MYTNVQNLLIIVHVVLYMKESHVSVDSNFVWTGEEEIRLTQRQRQLINTKCQNLIY